MKLNNCWKQNRQILSATLILLAGISSQAALGQSGDSLSLYLKEAADHNPGLKARFFDYRASLERVPQAGSLPDPEVQFGFLIKPMQLLGGNQLGDIRLMQMSPWFGTLKAAKDEASKMAIARYEDMLNERNELFLKVKLSWYETYRIQSNIRITTQNMELLQSLERMALVRFRAAENIGSGSMVNVLRVRMEIGVLANDLAFQKDELVTAKTRFNALLNRKPDSEVFIPDTLSNAVLPGTVAALADSLVNNPMVRMLEAEKEAGNFRIDMARRMGLPKVGLGLDYTFIGKRAGLPAEMNGRDMIMPMLTATLPIYRKKYEAQKQEAEYQLEATGQKIENTLNELQVKYQEAVQLYHDADRRLELYKTQIDLARKTIQLLTSSFSSANTDFEEILRMQRQLLDYQFKQIEALVDRNMAIAGILAVIAYN